MSTKTLRKTRTTGSTSGTPVNPGAIPKKGLVGSGSLRGGNPRSADNGGTPVVSTRSAGGQSGGSVLSPCGSCEVSVGQDGIGCDKCENWFHPSPLCMGVSHRVIEVILEAGGAGIEYVCTQCRARPLISGASKDSLGSPALDQLFTMVKSLCSAIAKLTERVDSLAPNAIAPVSVTRGSSGEDLKMAIREEIVEMEERKKRRESVIFRGVGAESNDDARSRIANITRFLLNDTPLMSDLFCIDRNKGLYRVKIPDDDMRRKLVMEAKNLRNNPEYNNIYVNRDLTFKQRRELYERRQGNRQAGASAQPGPQPASSAVASTIAAPLL